MKLVQRISAGAFTVACMFGAAAITANAQVIYAPAPPMPPVVRAYPEPTRGYVWVSGYYMWNSNRYVWIPGHWAPAGYQGVSPSRQSSYQPSAPAPAASETAPSPLTVALQQMQRAAARNEQQLHTYQWVESTTLTVGSRTMPPKQSYCRYAADGTVLKTPIGPPAQGISRRGGPLAMHMEMQKMRAVQEDVQEVQALVKMYLPLNQAHLGEIVRNGTVELEHEGTSGTTLIIRNYAKTGDQLKLALNRTTMQVDRISISSYFDTPKHPMTAEIHFARLADGTVYPALTSIEAPSKKLSMVTASSEFSKIAY